MIPRTSGPILRDLATRHPVVTVTGPRQSGKTTLCRDCFPDKAYANLESPDVREFANSDPRGFLASYPDGVILDEIQRAPELPSYLQGMVDDKPQAGRYVLTGSQQFEVMSNISQSLAGRTALVKLLPFSMEEMHSAGMNKGLDELMFSGFYPRIHDRGLQPAQALGDYIETYVERDLRRLAAIRDLRLFQTFMRLCAGRVGQLLNLQSLGNDCGVSHTTARNWVGLLQASYIVFVLPPWHTNLSKRQIKSPKLYFYDVGLAGWLLGAERPSHIDRHPLRGQLFENLVVMEALKYRLHRGKRSNLYFWRDAKNNEVDLLAEHGPDVTPIEIKAGQTINPDYFKGLSVFADRLGRAPRRPTVIYAGTQRQDRSNASVWPAGQTADFLRELDRG